MELMRDRISKMSRFVVVNCCSVEEGLEEERDVGEFVGGDDNGGLVRNTMEGVSVGEELIP